MKNNDFDFIPLSQGEEDSVLNGAMAKINAFGKTKSKAKRFSIPVIIAAAVAVTGISAAAIGISGIDWFKSFYGGKSDTPLETYANAQMLDGMAQAYDDISVSKDGITVEFLGAIAYGNSYQFSFLITNENIDTIFNDGNKSYTYFMSTVLNELNYGISTGQIITSEDDETLLSNQYIYVATINSENNNSAESCTVTFDEYGYKNFDEETQVIDYSGSISLDAPIPVQTENAQALVFNVDENISYSHITKVSISPVTIEIIHTVSADTFRSDEYAENFDLFLSDDNLINFADGTSVSFKEIGSGASSVDIENGDIMKGTAVIELDTAIDLDQIESITLDGTVYKIN